MDKYFSICLFLLLNSCNVSTSAGQYYVDFAKGSDNAAGSTLGAPWQHAPGDPAAVGVAAETRLVPGDIVRFKGGVAYRGQIIPKASGQRGNPITFSGVGYGAGAAIIEGANPVDSVVPCPSQAACDGALNWKSLSLISFVPPSTSLIKLFGSRGLMFTAQRPAPPDPFFGDDVSSYLVSPLSDKAMIEAGRLPAPELARALAGKPDGTLLIWVRGNQVVRRAVTGVDGDIVLFDPKGIKLYPDRAGRYALLGNINAIAAPGQFVAIAPGRAVAWLPDGDSVQIGDGRDGFNLTMRENIVITGFTFRHQTAASDEKGQGAPIKRARLPAGSGLLIENNRFEDMALWDGKGVISLTNISDVVVRNNMFSMIERGSGIRTGVNIKNLTIENNVFNGIGRTGIAILGAEDSVIRGNIMTKMHGVHGNGISFYLANRRVSAIDNRIDDTTRPMTFHGDKSRVAPGDHDLVIDRNIFLATKKSQAALTGWGAHTRGVTITRNVLVAPKGGLLTNGGDTGVTVKGNYVSGILFNKGQGADWVVADNKTAPKTMLNLPADAAAIAALCANTGVPAGQTLGGYRC